MAVLEIVQDADTNAVSSDDATDKEKSVLYMAGEPITDFSNPDLQSLIDDMIETMRDANGVGLAAPQIGKLLQLAVIETLAEHDDEGEPIPDTRELFVIINPRITWESRKMATGVEGCLSVLGYLGEVERHLAIRVQAHDRNGRRRVYRLKGWDARIFQHEIDHINGIMYTDKLTAPENFWTEEAYEKMVEEEEERQKEKG